MSVSMSIYTTVHDIHVCSALRAVQRCAMHRAVNFQKTTDETTQDKHKKRKTEKNTSALGSAWFLCFRELSKSSTSREKLHCSSTVRLPMCSVGKDWLEQEFTTRAHKRLTCVAEPIVLGAL